MNPIARFLITLLSLLAALGNYCLADFQPVPDGATFQSPDRKYNIRLKGDVLSITNSATAVIDNSNQTLMPVFSIRWSKDSKSFVSVCQIAGGSTADVFHLQDGNWKRIDTEPTDDDSEIDSYEVIGQNLEGKVIQLTYKVDEETVVNDHHVATYFKFVLAVDPTTGAIKLLKKQPIQKW